MLLMTLKLYIYKVFVNSQYRDFMFLKIMTFSLKDLTKMKMLMVLDLGFFLLYIVLFSTAYENSLIENSSCIRVVDTEYN